METKTEERLSASGQDRGWVEDLRLPIYEVWLVATGFVGGLLTGLLVLGLR